VFSTIDFPAAHDEFTANKRLRDFKDLRLSLGSLSSWNELSMHAMSAPSRKTINIWILILLVPIHEPSFVSDELDFRHYVSGMRRDCLLLLITMNSSSNRLNPSAALMDSLRISSRVQFALFLTQSTRKQFLRTNEPRGGLLSFPGTICQTCFFDPLSPFIAIGSHNYSSYRLRELNSYSSSFVSRQKIYKARISIWNHQHWFFAPFRVK